MEDLILERVSVYDVLASKLNRKCFEDIKAHFDSILDYVDEEGFSLGTIFEYPFEFPRTGWGKKELPEKGFSVTLEISDYTGHATTNEYGFGVNGLAVNNGIQLDFVVNDLDYFLDNVDWQEVYRDLLQIIRHELEHLAQFYREDGIPIHYYDADQDYEKRESSAYERQAHSLGFDKHVLYATELSSEIEAELKSMYFISKKTKEPVVAIATKKLKQMNISDRGIAYILKKWGEYAKKHFPYIKF